MYYRPYLAAGKLAPLPWQIYLFLLNGNWPMSDTATVIHKFINTMQLVILFSALMFCTEGEFNFIINNTDNIGLVLIALPTLFVCVEMLFRIFDMAHRRDGLKEILKKFYAEIYFERTPEYETIYDDIQRLSRPSRFSAFAYFGTLFTAILMPVAGLFQNQKLFPSLMLPHYDYQPWLFYIPTLATTFLGSSYLVFQQSGESILLVSLILNLNGRYLLLQRDLRNLYDETRSSSTIEVSQPDLMVSKFRNSLAKIINTNVNLNQFASQIQQQYTFRIFVIMSLSALMVCVLGLKLLKTELNIETILYGIWITTKIAELLNFGKVGSTIITTTDEMSLAYYSSNWEQIIGHSRNAKQNSKLMKTIMIAIELNQKPINFSGFGFFYLSLPTAALILRGAASYFTSLYAIQ